jgi:DNA-binding MarR family transcriptional regulator/N-acetylglutamate synthase-like GNAT family acetyltransferase
MSVSPAEIDLVRAFNRDYTRRIGVLRDGLLDSPYSLTEVRVMYELAHRRGVGAAELAADLDLDRGYLSRLLKRFERAGLLQRTVSATDARRWHLALTAQGRKAFAPLERRSQRQMGQMLSALDPLRRRTVLDAMRSIQTSFAAPSSPQQRQELPIRFRSHRPGDMGWVIARHGELYAAQFGWNEQFEALVAGIAAEFLHKLDPRRERCWIAERAGQRLGCVFLVAAGRRTAKLRLLLVEPEARGAGLGRELTARCLQFARECGYRRVKLWTQQSLLAGRHVYIQAGFVKTSEQAHHSFGHDLVGETWELAL